MSADRERLYVEPIKFRAAPGVLEEAAMCEWPSWEDQGSPAEAIGSAHAHVIFGRLKQALVIYSPLEAANVIGSLDNSADIKGDVGHGSFDQETATAARHETAFRRMLARVRSAAANRPQVEPVLEAG